MHALQVLSPVCYHWPEKFQSYCMDKELPVSYEIYSVSGMAVKMKKLGRLQTGKIRLDDSGVNKGIYLLKVYKGAEVSVFKIMKY